MPRVFLITGTSTGFGYYYAQEVLDRGDIVVATARDPSKLTFANATETNFLAVRLDVTDKSSIDSAFESALTKFGRIDVVVNNAGYGLAGCFEEYTDSQIRQQMEINFFGLLDVTRKAMEVMRDRQTPSGGLIQQVTSIGGQRGVPLFSVYCASKWAVEGFTEALSHEVKPEWRIKFTLIEPGGFRTDWAGRSMVFADRHPAYDHIDARERMGKRHGTQAGDPVKGARAMYELAVMENPPLRVVIGTDAYAAIMNKLEQYEQNYKQFEALSNSTDVDSDQQ
ncbi:NAD(P)-binding protein, partial [Aureobasidium melanogenum]